MKKLQIKRLIDNEITLMLILSDEYECFINEELKSIMLIHKNHLIGVYPLTHFYLEVIKTK